MAPDRQRLASLTRLSADVEQLPPPSILTPAGFLPCLVLCRCQGVSVSAVGRLSPWDTSWGYPASHTHGIADGTGSANGPGQRGSITSKVVLLIATSTSFFLTDTAIPLVSGAGTLPLSIHPTASIFSLHSSSKSFFTVRFSRNNLPATPLSRGETPFTPP